MSSIAWTPLKTSEDILQPLFNNDASAYCIGHADDLFAEQVPFLSIDKVFSVMALRPRHTFTVVTHCPERIDIWAAHKDTFWTFEPMGTLERIKFSAYHDLGIYIAGAITWPLPNVTFGDGVNKKVYLPNG